MNDYTPLFYMDLITYTYGYFHKHFDNLLHSHAKGTVSGHLETVEIPTSHMSP